MSKQSADCRLRPCLDLAMFEQPDRAGQAPRSTQPLKEISSENALIELLLDRLDEPEIQNSPRTKRFSDVVGNGVLYDAEAPQGTGL